MVVDGGDPPPVGGGGGGAVREEKNTVSGSAGSSHSPTAGHQSVTRAQSPAYDRTVRADSCGAAVDVIDTVVTPLQANLRDGIAYHGCIFTGANLEHRW